MDNKFYNDIDENELDEGAIFKKFEYGGTGSQENAQGQTGQIPFEQANSQNIQANPYGQVPTNENGGTTWQENNQEVDKSSWEKVSSVTPVQNEVEQTGTINVPGQDSQITKRGFWSKFKSLFYNKFEWNKKVEVELTPMQQKVEDDVNKFLSTEVKSEKIWNKVHNFFFTDIGFDSSNKKEQL